MPLRTLILVATLACTPAWAETCKYVDADGRVIYSNTPSTPPKGAKKVKCFEDPKPAPAAGAPQDPGAQPKSAGDSRKDFPRVDGQTQKKRDDERRKILEEELATEERALEEAKAQLAEQESTRTGGEKNYQRFLDRIQPFRDAVTNHERNIDSIRRELASLR
ncbi:MAG TPA: DUF4124 domain-containing protein [Burkholderiales bacterium]|jgi:hypothetical protein|nr:DUF4124 domain-containing protein [Burkholderiales bacterium]